MKQGFYEIAENIKLAHNTFEMRLCGDTSAFTNYRYICRIGYHFMAFINLLFADFFYKLFKSVDFSCFSRICL